MTHNPLGSDLEQLIKDAKYARMKFVLENFRFFVYGSSLFGLFCASIITLLSVGSATRPDDTQVSHAAKAISRPLSAVR
jgi:hypothetical protein